MDIKNVQVTKVSDGATTKISKILEGEEYLELIKKLKKRKKILKCIPRLIIQTSGHQASFETKCENDYRIPISLSDVQNLLIYSVIGNNAPYMPDRWCILEKWNKVSHTVLLVVEGLSSNDFLSDESSFPSIREHFENKLELVTPVINGGSIIEELVPVALSHSHSSRIIRKYGSLENALKETSFMVKMLKTVFPPKPLLKNNDEEIPSKKIKQDLPEGDKFARTDLLLSPVQLIEENFPLPFEGELANKYKYYKPTKDVYVEATPKSPMFAVDCEMCLTTSRKSELTRISVVDENMKTLYDTLVQPENKIINYLTRFSGITKEMMENVTTTLEDVQNKLREILPADAILIGQSLNSDLHALQMMHPYVIDTSVIFNVTGDRFRKSKLQLLMKEFLNEEIQMNKSGHCSTEDSKACMKLVKLKLSKNISYGDCVLLGREKVEIQLQNAKENRVKQYYQFTSSLFNHITSLDKKTVAIFGRGEIVGGYSMFLQSNRLQVMDDENFQENDNVRLVITETDQQAVNRATEIAQKHHFSLCHVRLEQEKEEKKKKIVSKLIRKIWDSCSNHALVCVVFGGTKTCNGACFVSIKKINS